MRGAKKEKGTVRFLSEFRGNIKKLRPAGFEIKLSFPASPEDQTLKIRYGFRPKVKSRVLWGKYGLR